MRLVLLTGFLGSGKTTLLLALVRALVPRGPGRCVVLENEVGETSIDGPFLAGQGLEVRELFAGCVCCQLAGSLVSTLNEIESTLKPAAVFLEASGLANPVRLLETLAKYGKVVDKTLVITLIDLERLEMLLEVAEPLIRSQVEPASLLVLNKTDLAGAGAVNRVADSLAQINPHAEILNVSALEETGTEELAERVWRWWN